MRLNAIIPCLGMVALSVCAAFAGNGNPTALVSPSFNPYPANGATAFFEKNIGREAALGSITVDPISHATCYGVSSGAITVNVVSVGTSGNYTYNIAGTNYFSGSVNTTAISSGTSFTFSGLHAGTYTVTVSRNGDTGTQGGLIVKHPPGPMAATGLAAQTTCAGGSDGSITLKGTFPAPGTYGDMSLVTTATVNLTAGPGAPMSMAATISGNMITGTFSPLAPGTYSGNIVYNGCSPAPIATIIVSSPSAVILSTSTATPANCFDQPSGSVTVAAATGGTGAKTYTLTGLNHLGVPVSKGPQAGTTFTGLKASDMGGYDIEATDANGCVSNSINQVVTQPNQISFMPATVNNQVSCNGGTNGSVSFTIMGGTSPYTVNLGGGFSATGASPLTISGLPAGAYSGSITDSKGCVPVGTINFTITQPNAIASNASQVNVLCFGGTNGSIDLSVNGGTPGYMYDWGGGITTQDRSGLSAGTYTVTITDTKMCTKIHSVTITQPAAPLSASTTTTQPSCFGGNNGSVTVSATGGTAPYSGTGTFTGLAAGTYSYTVTDANNCTTTVSATVTQPSQVVATATAPAVLCNGGTSTVTVSATGGTAPYANVGTFTRPAGTHIFTVTDANSCTGTASVTITEPTVLSASSSSTTILCNGGSSTVTVSATGGTAPYTGTGNFTVTAGTYSYTVTDANGCTKTTSITVSEPTVLVASSSATAILCNGGNSTVTVSASGGTAPYTGTGTFTVVAGTHTYTVTDANGCTKTTSITVSEPTVLVASSSATAILCNGGSSTVTVSASGGTAPYTGTGTFTVVAGTHTYTVTDANGCTKTTSITVSEPTVLVASSSATPILCNGGSSTVTVSATGGTAPYTGTGTFTPVAGTHIYTVTDANGCSATTSVTIGQPTLLEIINPDFTGPTCYGQYQGVGNAEPMGGTGPYVFSFTAVPADVNNFAYSATYNYPPIPLAGDMFTDFSNGTYYLLLTDNNGCTTQDTFDIIEPTPIVITEIIPVHQDNKCFGDALGEFTVEATGGTADYNFYMDGNLVEPDNTMFTMTGLAAGTYNIEAKDVNGCMSAITSIVITEPDAWSASLVATPVTCNGDNDGTLTVTLDTSGYNLAPYVIDLFGVNQGLLTTTTLTFNDDPIPPFTGLDGDDYYVVVTDDNGCSIVSDTVTVEEPLPLLIVPVPVITDATCNGKSDGSISFSICGGIPEYEVVICEQGTTNIVPGTPNPLEVTGGCFLGQAVLNFAGFVPQNQFVITSPTRVDQVTDNPMSFRMRSWNNNTTNDVAIEFTVPADFAEVRLRGIYSTVDPRGSAADPLLYSVNNGPFVSLTNPNTPFLPAIPPFIPSYQLPQVIRQFIPVVPGDVIKVKLATIDGKQGIATYRLQLSAFKAGSAFAHVGGLPAGDYTAKLTDANGCTDTYDFTVAEPDPISATVAGSVNVSCKGGSDGEVDLDDQGGTSPFTYVLGQTSNNTGVFTGLIAGPHTVAITDANGCTGSYTFTLTEPTAITVTTTTTVVSCKGGADGSVQGTISGGTAPYGPMVHITGPGGYDEMRTISGNTFSTAEVLAAGAHMFSFTDANGCLFEGTFTITEPELPLTSVITSVNPSCFGNTNGSITVVGAGGTAGYTYSIDGGAYGTDETFYNLVAGTYAIRVRDSKSCVKLTNVTLTQPAQLMVAVNVPQYSCTGGELTLTMTGGTGPYKIQQYLCDYSMTVGAAVYTAVGQSAYTFTNMGDNQTFCFLVSDVNNCGPVPVTAFIQPGQVISPALTAIVSSQTNVACFGTSTGSFTVAATGGIGSTFTYAVSPAATQMPNGTFTGLAAGTYSVTVTEAPHGCTIVVSATITEPSSAVLSASTAGVISCFGGTTTVTVSATGGTAPYSGTGVFTVSAGAYSYTVTDANGCMSTTTGNISQPSALSASAVAGTIACFGGTTTVTVSATGGTAPYTGTGVFTVSAGAYSYPVTDANGCVSTTTGNISQPSALSASAVAGTIACFGGTTTVTVSATGGTAPYTGTGVFTVSAGAYSYTVTDANGCVSTTTGNISQPSALSASAVAGTISCFGGTTMVTVSAMGGTAPYAGTGTFPVLAGTHSFTVTDNNGCSTSTTIIITEPTEISISLSAINGSGCTQNGTITASVTGGSPAYSYVWSNNAGSTPQISPATGSYSVTVMDSNGCTKTAGPISVTQPVLVAATATSTPADCNGAANGTIFVSASGGTSPYFYSKNGGMTFQTGATFGSLVAGNYNVVVKDDNGCTYSVGVVTVSEPTAITATSTTQPAGCNGAANGSFTVMATGGTPTYLYSKDGGMIFQPSSTFAGLTAGSYAVVVRDNNGCTFSMTVVVPISTGPTVTASAGTILCNGGTTTVTLNVTGGLTPYTNAGSFTRPAGTHIFTVTDANGCSGTASVTIAEPTLLTASSSATAILCNGGNSTVTVSAMGGTAPYTGTGTFTRTAGTWSFIVTDANGCTAATSVTISQPAALTATSTATAILCNGGNSTVTVSATGGTAPFTGTGTFTQTAGQYSYTITDANGCTAITSVTISQPAVLMASSTATAILCNGGNSTVTVSATGGTAPFTGTGTFTRTAGTWSFTVTDANGCTSSTLVTIGQPAVLTASASTTAILCMGGSSTVTVSAAGGTAPFTGTGTFTQTAGQYSYTVTDANGCTAITSATITEPTMLALTETHVNSTCGTANGSIDLSVSGGTPGYMYLWSNQATTQDVSGLAPGNYSVIVTDANGCSKSLAITITQTPSVTLSTAVTNVLCNGGATGAINLTVNTGTAPFTYLWNNQATTEDLTGLVAGTYSVVVTAANGCTAAASATVAQPTALVATAVPGTIFCNGGTTSVEVAATGGTAPYSGTGNFTASAGTYSYTITDANGCTATATGTISQPAAITVSETHTSILCNGGTASVTISAQGGTGVLIGTGTFPQSAGTVVYTVTDENNCSKTISVTLTQPDALVAAETHGSILCNGGSTTVTVTATGGTAPYTGTGTFTQSAGTVVYTVTDANGCISIKSVTITQPTPLSASAVASGGLCGATTGCITVTPTGGTPGYQILVQNATGGTVGQGATTQPGGTYQLCQLPLGQYSVIITDANGCTSISSATIVGQPAVTVSMVMNNVTCFGLNNGSIDLTIATGTAPFTYSWMPGGATTQDLTNLAPGSYSVTVTDANGCSFVKTATITQPNLLEMTETHVNASCGNPNGTITLTPTGGTAPYTFTLNGGASQTNGSFSGLAANTYNAVVTDANGCTKTLSVVITQSGSPVQIATQVVQVLCFGNSTGSITATASAGTAPYMYRIGTGVFGTNNVFPNLTAGTYAIEAKDANGCLTSVQVTVSQPTAALNATAIGSPALCAGASNGSITVTATGGTPAYMYKIGNGAFQTGNVFTNLAAGTYVIVVKDANGCEKSVQATVQQPAALNVTATAVDATCNGIADGKIGVSATGGTPAYMYQLNNGAFQSSNQFNNLGAGTYTVTAKDANGCTATTTATINQPQAGPLGIALDQILPVTCMSNGAILVTVSGCGPFTFTWTKPNGDVVGSTEDLLNVPAGTYNLLVIDGGGMTATLTGTVVPNVPLNIQNLAVENNTTCAVTLTWSATSNTDGYEVRFKPCNATVWTTFTGVTTTSYTFTGLSPLTCYDFCVRYKKDPCFGDWTCITGNVTPQFNPPVNTTATVNSNSSATIKWAQSNCGGQTPSNVELRFRKVGVTTWTVITLAGSSTNQTLNNLTPNTCYEYRLRNRYVVAGVTKWSSFTPIKQFCLPLNLSGSNGTSLVKPEDEIISIEYDVVENTELVEQPTRDISAPTLDFTLFPNPTSDFVNLRFSSIDATNSLTIKLLSLSGQLISQQTILDPNGIADQQLDVNPLPQGFYLIEVSNGTLRRVEKFVKQ